MSGTRILRSASPPAGRPRRRRVHMRVLRFWRPTPTVAGHAGSADTRRWGRSLADRRPTRPAGPSSSSAFSSLLSGSPRRPAASRPAASGPVAPSPGASRPLAPSPAASARSGRIGPVALRSAASGPDPSRRAASCGVAPVLPPFGRPRASSPLGGPWPRPASPRGPPPPPHPALLDRPEPLPLPSPSTLRTRNARAPLGGPAP